MKDARTHRAGERGYLTLGALVGLSLLSLVIIFTWREIQRTTAVITLLRSTDRAYTRALVATFERLRERTGGPYIDELETVYSEGRFGDASVGITAKIAARDPRPAITAPLHGLSAPHPSPFPFFDLDRLLSASTPCPLRSPSKIGRTLSGAVLTPGSLTSSEICAPPLALIRGGGSFRENIHLITPTLLKSPSLAEPITVVAAGFLEATSPLEIRGSVLLVAGGDLLLTDLVTIAPSTATLISATGRVVVGQVSPQLSLRAYGYAGIDLPENAHRTVAAPLPPIRERILLGVRRGPP